MIHHNKRPLSEPERRQLEEWLGLPGRAIFQKFLEDSAALSAAMAANKLVEYKQGQAETEKEENAADKSEAEALAREAERWIYLAELLNKMRDKDYEFFAVSLSARPINT